MSIEDDDIPIKVQNSIEKSLSILNEDDDNLTEFEKWQKDKNKKDAKSKEKAKKYERKTDKLGFMHDYANRYQDTRKRNTRPDLAAMADISDITKYKKEELMEFDNFDIDEYLDDKIAVNAKLTSNIKTTLSRFDSKFSKQPKKKMIIFEEKKEENEKE
jgi:hypothetical protein